MKCDICGAETAAPPDEDTFSSDPKWADYHHWVTKTSRLTMGPACARERRRTKRAFLWAILGMIGGLIAIGLLARF